MVGYMVNRDINWELNGISMQHEWDINANILYAVNIRLSVNNG